MLIPNFSVSRLPRIVFGRGTFYQIPTYLQEFGKRVLVVTGERSLRGSLHWQGLIDTMKGRKISREDMVVRGEPTPMVVDQAVRVYRSAGIEVVLGIGGGSVIDAAKSIAALLPHGNSVMEHLEGIGPQRPYQGPGLPCIAVPTTAGTGSEATRNAVLGIPGFDGFKKSFRHEALTPQYAVIDPDLLATCPPELIAANGLDALTQLIESYVSSRPGPLTDALAESGLKAVKDGLLPWYERALTVRDAQEAMAYAALVSGICLAQTGLGAVHGLASPLGAFFSIPHGTVCGMLLTPAIRANLKAMDDRLPGSGAYPRYATVGRILTGNAGLADAEARQALLDLLCDWETRLAMPRLRDYDVRETDIPLIVANSRGNSMKTNPVELNDEELAEILKQAI